MADTPRAPFTGPMMKCPGCGCDVRYDPLNPFRPFCSERCRMADLGAWASEGYRIPDSTPADGMLPADSTGEED